MSDAVTEFLDKYPTAPKSRWLYWIIEALIQSGGRAHVRIIAQKISKKFPHVGRVEESITRAINNFCGEAADFRKPAKYNLFERVEPATYRLRSYPQRPNLFDLVGVEFEEPGMQYVWKLFVDVVRKKERDLSEQQILTLLVSLWNSEVGEVGKWLRELYESEKAAIPAQ